MPLEEDARLFDPGLRESFISRLYVYQDWLDTTAAGLSAEVLIKFYGRYKYMLMAHHVPSYKTLGRVLVDAGNRDVDELGLEMMNLMMLALKKPANRKGFTNALQHVCGCLKRDLAPGEKRDVDQAIEQYRLRQTAQCPMISLANTAIKTRGLSCIDFSS